MCSFIAALSFLGPRLGFLAYWLFPYGQPKISAAVNGWFWPLLGLIFLPWTILVYTIVFPVIGLDWAWMTIAVLADLGCNAASAARRKDVSWYTGPKASAFFVSP